MRSESKDGGLTFSLVKISSWSVLFRRREGRWALFRALFQRKHTVIFDKNIFANVFPVYTVLIVTRIANSYLDYRLSLNIRISWKWSDNENAEKKKKRNFIRRLIERSLSEHSRASLSLSRNWVLKDNEYWRTNGAFQLAIFAEEKIDFAFSRE